MSNQQNTSEQQRDQIQEIYRGDLMTKSITRVNKELLDNKDVDRNADAEKIKPKSLLGKIHMKDMGSSLETVSKKNYEQYLAYKTFTDTDVMKKNGNISKPIGHDDVMLNYYPDNSSNKKIYDKIMHWVLINLFDNDSTHEILLATVDCILTAILGGRESDDIDDETEHILSNMKNNIERQIGMLINDTKFHELFTLVKQITNFNQSEKNTNEVKAIMDSSDEEIDLELDDESTNTNDKEPEFDFEEESEDENEIISNPEEEKQSSTEKQEMNDEGLWSIYDIDEQSIQNYLNEYSKKGDVKRLANNCINLIENTKDLENVDFKLDMLFDFDELHLSRKLYQNRLVIKWGLKYFRADDKEGILDEMRDLGLEHLFEKSKKRLLDSTSSDDEGVPHKMVKLSSNKDRPQFVDLNSMEFSNTDPIITKTKISLPPDSYKKIKSHYEEIHVPPPKPINDSYPLVKIQELPEWAQPVFPQTETKTLNRVQSEVFPAAFHATYNILLCAPTGAGKTNVAMLTILKAFSSHVNEKTGKIDLSKVKVVYIAPLKALVQEQVREFERRLQCFNINVVELTGDSNLSRSDIKNAHILVSTPEKWDVISRKKSNSRFIDFVKLLIIDEVHLLHDQRGPVLENIVARTIDTHTRIVALSATLPNYEDVAHFLNVETGKGLFHFSSNYRPCPLAQQYIGVSQSSPLKKLQSMNQACYDKVIESVIDGKHQVIVFVHSRKDTAKTAKWLIEKLKEEDRLSEFLSQSQDGSSIILNKEAENIQDGDLKEFVKNGFGIHHAGLDRNDRSLSEDLFADGLLKVLVSTATLAWGVNLPAHTVVIKGTDVYSPQLNRWVQLSPQDMLQMLGRAGRPRYDTHGEGIIITNKEDVNYYLAVLNEQLPIESQMISKLVDSINAEVVLGSIQKLPEAVKWFQKTYLYSRMLASPDLYKVENSRHPDDDTYYYFCEDLCHTALSLLHDHDLVQYDEETGHVRHTPLGRIASFYYLSYESVSTYNRSLETTDSLIEIFKLFASSSEFKYMSVREEEKYELKKLMDNTPIPVKETVEESTSKINVLLQAYISRLRLDGYALNADMVFINQNAGRLFRALFEISLKKKWAKVSKLLLNVSLYISKRMWLNNCPLRQFSSCPPEAILKMEMSPIPFKSYLALKSPGEVGEAIRLEKFGKSVFDLLSRYPQVSVHCTVQPITRSVLRFDIEITPEWKWDNRYHSSVEPFWILLEDVNGDEIIFMDVLKVTEDSIGVDSFVSFTIELPEKLQEHLPPNYFVTVISDNWLNCEYKSAVIFKDLILPKQFPAPSTIQDVKVNTISDLHEEEFNDLFTFQEFNTIQNQVFEPIYNSNENVLLCSPKDTGKTTMAMIAILNHWRQNKSRAVYICPDQLKIDMLMKKFKLKFSQIGGGKNIAKFVHDVKLNVEIFSKNHLVLATPEQFEVFSRRWRYRKALKKLELIIFDDIHEVSNHLLGSIYEILVSRMILMVTQLECKLRVVGFANSLSNAKDLGEWMNVSKKHVFNFANTERVSDVLIHVKSADEENFESEYKNIYEKMKDHIRDDSVPLIFVPSRKEAVQTSKSILKYFRVTDFEIDKHHKLEEYFENVSDSALKWALTHGIGFFYKDMPSHDFKIVMKALRNLGAVICTKDCILQDIQSDFVFVKGTSYFEGSEYKTIDYSLNSLLEMIGCSKNNTSDSHSTVHVLTTEKMSWYYKKFFKDGQPIESFLPFSLEEFIVNECANGIITSKDDIMEWITYSYFYRRIHANPSYYGVKDVSTIGLSAYFTELFERVLAELVESKFITLENYVSENGDELVKIHTAADAVISSHYSLSLISIKMYGNSLSKVNKMSKVLEILSLSDEFSHIEVRLDEPAQLYALYNKLPMKISDFDNFHLSSPAFKVFVLLQAYFSRISLNPSFEADLKAILVIALRLVNAMVDVLSSKGSLNVLLLMEVSQMLVQGCWETDSPLTQIPFFSSTDGMLEKCEQLKVESVYSIMELDDEDRDNIMQLIDNKKKLKVVAEFVNQYPNLEINLETGIPQKGVSTEETYNATVTIVKDDEPDTLEVVSEKFPDIKREEWWIVLGNKRSKTLLAIKKVVLDQETNVFNLQYALQDEATQEMTLWCVCDSYLYCDKEISINYS